MATKYYLITATERKELIRILKIHAFWVGDGNLKRQTEEIKKLIETLPLADSWKRKNY